jgi:hypothetical protein
VWSRGRYLSVDAANIVEWKFDEQLVYIDETQCFDMVLCFVKDSV